MMGFPLCPSTSSTRFCRRNRDIFNSSPFVWLSWDRSASSALDEEPLDRETIKRISKALNDLKEGRYIASREIEEMLELP